ncbi:hypothetical protein [Comamonas sp. JC664]|uniref:hypothetical protein n=1 Tax=Comamonas sp. JC664 TaxID=2801917 RepID=UPI00174E6D1C|nr:hypothetical protein [Comamonas sp. JC664]MBL0697930.1 hypothetical protein [Comamonas sp. JC664]GHG70438.1 hypothetical protein GCM10012319_15280 [Comamonas sp. KCTC 72670]
MIRPFKTLVLALPVLVLSSGCNLFDISDAEGTRGRGATAFDPYASSASGAISLSLMAFKGCAILPSGEPVTKGGLDLPQYPDECLFLNDGFPLPAATRPPTARLTVSPGQLYFLREFSVMDTVQNVHTDFNDRRTPAAWARLQSDFKDLDWSGLTTGVDDWVLLEPGVLQRETLYENAAWMISNDDTFLLEVLDADGNVRASETYLRTDFLSESSAAGRTRVSFSVSGLAPPLFPGDPVPRVGVTRESIDYVTSVKVSFANSTNPFKSFAMPQLTGEGVIRVTWSLLPGKPFHFPITFLPDSERPATCFEVGPDGLPTDVPTTCGFGLNQTLKLARPQNGRFHLPGENIDFVVSLQDGDGHALHPRDSMPSFREFMAEDSNGLSYFNSYMLVNWLDGSATESGYKVVGPLQDLTVVNGSYTAPYFSFPNASEPAYYVHPAAAFRPGGHEHRPTTRYSVPLPSDAKPGTYAILLKGHRNYLGERLNRLDPFFFQVGQETPTTYPGRIGNCQVCHNGANSLSNVHHGVSVDHVETCKVCHFDDTVGHSSDFMHRIHINSRKYAQNKGDCTVCHLTRESALRPSLIACAGCHPGTHGNEFKYLEFQNLTSPPNIYGNCANACHLATPPTEHVLPPR